MLNLAFKGALLLTFLFLRGFAQDGWDDQVSAKSVARPWSFERDFTKPVPPYMVNSWFCRKTSLTIGSE
jgi:hypothetical protein